ncbi:Streptomycin biosynthesis protein StrG [Diplonema papillatum]|nr:Streptomycin biosynthesis protein StrG [Diplonema papillatum]KAJ9448261.1 Streptomycin biosynthesis protein StrG [Diplonema papillatum]
MTDLSNIVPKDSVKCAGPLPDPLPLPDDLIREKIVGVPADIARELELCVKAMLGLAPTANLGKLHESPEGSIEVARRGSPERMGRLTCFNRRWAKNIKPTASHFEEPGAAQARHRFQSALHRLLREVVAPDLGEVEQLVFQVWPTLRVHLAGTGKNVGRRHRDFDYFHPPSEVNYWVPLGCSVFGANSLYSESMPGRGDYHAFQASHGQAVRFYGNGCDHFTVPNTTDTTRVSLDLRVLRAREYYQHVEPPNCQVPGNAQFIVGRYYTTLRMDESHDAGVQRALLIGNAVRSDETLTVDSSDSEPERASLFD